MKTPTVLLIAVLAFAGFTSAVHAAPGFGPGGFGGPGNPAAMLERMSDHLDLSADQQAAIESILEASKPEMRALRQQLKANREAIQALDPAGTSYAAELNNLALSNGELATTGTLLSVRVKTEVAAVLTDEQKARLKRGKERMQKRIKARFGQ
ncbi:MAG: Spy/CpxP family protein refolding chaperone [Pseudomonadota bacterium]